MIRLVTYNIKHAGLKGLDAVARVLAAVDADLVALQEVDVGVGRSRGVDQTDALGRALGMHGVHGPAFPLEGGHYGVALLSRFPIEAREVIPLPSPTPVVLPDGVEPRIALDARVALPAGVLSGRATGGGAADPLHVVVTHLGLDPDERLRQAEALVGHLAFRPRTLLAGDFNEGPGGAAFGLLLSTLIDCPGEAGLAPRTTFPSWEPVIAIDHVLRSRDLPAATAARRIPGDASDHLPVVVELG